MWKRGCQRQKRAGGFALPTVLIASTVMLIVMASSLATVSSTVVASLASREYSLYARTAAESGLAMAQTCLKQNNYDPQWTDAKPLQPNTDCSGNVQSGVSQYLHNTSSARSTFSVGAPSTISNGVQRVSVAAKTERMVVATGAVWRTYTDASYATISAQSTFNTVTFGYVGTSGAFFGVIDPLGQVSTVGYNANGQLGNGSTTNATSPQIYGIPAGAQASQLFSSLLSGGNALFAVTTTGALYGAGANSYGQLGNGSTASTQSTPVQFQLPAGVQASFVSVAATNTYVIGSDNNIYSAGSCGYGMLGSNYTISGCSNKSSYQRVALPTVNAGDTNTLPVASSDWVQATNLVTDRYTVYARMQGGKVYGWGANDYGQLGNGSTTNSSVPVQVTTLGNAGQPTAKQVAFDGLTVWILDSDGNVWATGGNGYADLGTSSPLISGSGKCIDDPGGATANGTRLQIYDCNNTASQLYEWAQDGSIIVRPNTSTAKCVENAGGSSGNGNAIQLNDCSGSNAQKWYMNDNGKIVNVGTGKCIDNPSNSSSNGNQLQQYTCNGNANYPNQTWTFGNRLTPQKIILPSGHGTVKRITTDQYATLLLMTDGTVWGYGFNTSGQLGNGGQARYNPAITQYILPSGRTAVDLYTTKSGSDSQTQYANTYVILDDGSVYGSGSNAFGQLGTGTTAATVLTPVKMVLPSGVSAQTVQTGFGTTVVLTNEGKIYTVGNNINGQLGDGTTTNSSTPLARKYVNTRPLLLY